MVDPVGVQHTQVATTTSDTLFGLGADVALEFDLANTLVSGLTVNGTLVVGPLAATTADAGAVDDETW